MSHGSFELKKESYFCVHLEVIEQNVSSFIFQPFCLLPFFTSSCPDLLLPLFNSIYLIWLFTKVIRIFIFVYSYYFQSTLPSFPLHLLPSSPPEREVRGSRPTAAVLCPWARHFTPRKYWLITQEAMAPSGHDWKIVDWDVKPQHNQPTSSPLHF